MESGVSGLSAMLEWKPALSGWPSGAPKLGHGSNHGNARVPLLACPAVGTAVEEQAEALLDKPAVAPACLVLRLDALNHAETWSESLRQPLFRE